MMYIVLAGSINKPESYIENDLNDVRRLTQSLVQRGFALEEVIIYEVEKRLLATIEFVTDLVKQPT